MLLKKSVLFLLMLVAIPLFASENNIYREVVLLNNDIMFKLNEGSILDEKEFYFLMGQHSAYVKILEIILEN